MHEKGSPIIAEAEWEYKKVLKSQLTHKKMCFGEVYSTNVYIIGLIVKIGSPYSNRFGIG